MIDRVAIWLPPADEHAAWQEFTGYSMTRAELEARVAEAFEEAAQNAEEVVIVPMPVAEMRARLGSRPNTQENRAAVVAGEQALFGMKLGGPEGKRQVVASAMLSSGKAERHVEPVGDDGIAGSVRRIMQRFEKDGDEN